MDILILLVDWKKMFFHQQEQAINYIITHGKCTQQYTIYDNAIVDESMYCLQ